MKARLERSVYLRSCRWHYTILERDSRTTAALTIFDSRAVMEMGFATYEEALAEGSQKRVQLEHQLVTEDDVRSCPRCQRQFVTRNPLQVICYVCLKDVARTAAAQQPKGKAKTQ